MYVYGLYVCVCAAVWWKQWLSFFFETEFEVSKHGKTYKTKVHTC